VAGSLYLSGDLVVAPSFDKEKFDNESLFDFIDDCLLTSSEDTTGRFTIIRTLDECIFIFILGL
jgi:hypothetical protein